jgi:hypothetical protein
MPYAAINPKKTATTKAILSLFCIAPPHLPKTFSCNLPAEIPIQQNTG